MTPLADVRYTVYFKTGVSTFTAGIAYDYNTSFIIDGLYVSNSMESEVNAIWKTRQPCKLQKRA